MTEEEQTVEPIEEAVQEFPDFGSISPEDFVGYIDSIFLVQKRRIMEHPFGKPEPFDERYIRESATMNKVLRERIKIGKEEPERSRLCWAHSYWWNRTHMLEALVRSRVGGIKVKKDIDRGGATLKKLIRGEQTIKDIHPEFLKLVDKLNSTNPQLPAAGKEQPKGG